MRDTSPELETLAGQLAGHADPDVRRLAMSVVSTAGTVPRSIRDVVAERQRQPKLGFTADHDAEHDDGALTAAAANYATAARIGLVLGARGYDGPPPLNDLFDPAQRLAWPWDFSWWKPGAGRRMLVKAAALLLAEIDRIDAIEGGQAEGGDHGR